MIFFYFGCSTIDNKLINPSPIVANPIIKNERAGCWIDLYNWAPIISPTLAFEAQIPINNPLPFLGNQLPKIAKLVAHPTDYKAPSIILIT